MDNQNGAYHLANNPDLYEIARDNNFEFILTGVDDLLRVGAEQGDSNAFIVDASQTIRFSVVSSSLPYFTQDVITVRRGNSVVKYAGMPTFSDGSLVINDFIGADSKSVIMAWQNLSYDVTRETIGEAKNYKKIAYLCEYTPDYRLVRTWKLMGCFVAGLSQSELNQESGNKRTISATIAFDKAIMEVPEEI